jgi:hypothetical protein
MTGESKSGKTTVANILVAKYGFQDLALATRVKQVCNIAYGLTDGQMYDQQQKEVAIPDLGTTPRELMQFVGTELFRDAISRRFPTIGHNTWNLALRRTIVQTPMSQPIVVTDVRYPDEREFLGPTAVVWRRPKPAATSNASQMLIGKMAAHPSEADNVPYNRIIPFTDTLAQLEECVAAALAQDFPNNHFTTQHN